MKQCQSLANQTLEMFCEALKGRAIGGAVRVQDIERLKRVFLEAEPSHKWLSRHAEFCLTEYETELQQRMRTDHLFRLIFKEFSGVIGPDSIQRVHIKRIRLAFAMLIGDRAVADYQVACNKVLADLNELSDDCSRREVWRKYFEDPRSVHIVRCCLTLIASHFHEKFETRRDWFLTFMASTLLDTSKQPRATPFTEQHFLTLMTALYSRHDITGLDADALARIATETGIDPAKVVGALLSELRRAAG